MLLPGKLYLQLLVLRRPLPSPNLLLGSGVVRLDEDRQLSVLELHREKVNEVAGAFTRLFDLKAGFEAVQHQLAELGIR